MRFLPSTIFSGLVVGVLALVSPANAAAQDPVKWTGTPPAATVRSGTTVSVAVMATIAPGWHIYSLTQGPGGPVQMRIALPKEQPFSLNGVIGAPVPTIEFDQNFGITVELYRGESKFSIPVRIAPDAQSGSRTARIAVSFQACNATTCLPPQTIEVPITINISSSGPKSLDGYLGLLPSSGRW